MSDDENMELKEVAGSCPNDLQCSTKRQEGYENTETLEQCPPGLWCKRSAPRDGPRDMDVFMEQIKAKRQGCPTGLWCALKREVEANVRVSDVCPPGLWCKRNEANNEEALIQKSHGDH